MAEFVFKLPDVGEGTAEAEIAAWHVRVGDVVKEDQPLVDVMTDKATVEMTSPVTGRVIKLNGDPGDMAAVGSALVVLQIDGGAEEKPQRLNGEAKAVEGAIPAAAAPKPRVKVPAGTVLGEGKPAPAAPEPTPTQQAAPSQSLVRPEPKKADVLSARPHVLAAPAVRDRAERLGLDLATLRGTGPEGRITHEDLDTALLARTGRSISPAIAQRADVEPIKVIGLRRKIAEKMQEANTIPHFTYVEEVDVTAVEDLRAHLNVTRREDRPKLTLLPFLMLAVSKCLRDFPQINARFDDVEGVIYRHQAVDLGIATQTDSGLMVPVVRNVEERDIWSCASEVQRLSAAARSGAATRGELSGSTITITSLGAMGGVVSTPVLNAPEVAIIGVNKILERPVVSEGQIVVRKMMNLSSSFDHRVVDGYDAAAFIQAVKGVLEQPASLFIPR
ncbi:MAG TPA: dihydrolipoamide acetyltransferase family protein [Caulobacterales bacterium]|nr:dihydrolipoamide acetyltransferase family protein [Caulobacterales bacterium]